MESLHRVWLQMKHLISAQALAHQGKERTLADKA
jgi:hypothetical protein